MLNDLLKIFKKPERDWSKSDRVFLNTINNLVRRQKQNESLMIMPANQSSYAGRKSESSTDPDYVGPMGYGGIGTKDRMPGTTPSKTTGKTKLQNKKIKSKVEKYPGFL